MGVKQKKKCKQEKNGRVRVIERKQKKVQTEMKYVENERKSEIIKIDIIYKVYIERREIERKR